MWKNFLFYFQNTQISGKFGHKNEFLFFSLCNNSFCKGKNNAIFPKRKKKLNCIYVDINILNTITIINYRREKKANINEENIFLFPKFIGLAHQGSMANSEILTQFQNLASAFIHFFHIYFLLFSFFATT